MVKDDLGDETLEADVYVCLVCKVMLTDQRSSSNGSAP
jgi:hypothetical protein